MQLWFSRISNREIGGKCKKLKYFLLKCVDTIQPETEQSNQFKMDTMKCVICYDHKASMFCGNCKQSSGVCGECYMTINTNEYGECGDYCEPIKCVICKSRMHYAALVSAFEMDVYEGIEMQMQGIPEEKAEKLADLLSDNAFL